MADINSNRVDRESGSVSGRSTSGDKSADSNSQKTRHLVEYVELLFFAYRDFTGEPDAILDEYGFGRAHHRVMHFVYRNPGLRVADLLEILNITKQSLARVLKQLIDDEFIVQHSGLSDRRERRLYVTKRGQNLAERLISLQCKRIEDALAVAGADSKDTIAAFLLAVVSPEDRAMVTQLVSRAQHKSMDERD
ncbi:MAG: MarR family winged helix-turn-helix transcriptional regulator [Hyphomicrobiaceae bacterium]